MTPSLGFSDLKEQVSVAYSNAIIKGGAAQGRSRGEKGEVRFLLLLPDDCCTVVILFPNVLSYLVACC
jgi:hypothetical protein